MRKDANSHPLFAMKQHWAKPGTEEGFDHQELNT